ncbi:hypothetical protein FJR48_04020 [Sulfurimonas lithotrophica]|uniref:Uncharacterized protein n=1 Tax=Sulfurimonas lithotrophica TaxID=2590022 RepID=A0A5P8P003_9BACT|nr:hypothetical protein [Sulfurimonas lithotrophica]QFR48930.1 hypothetical protein FJR48_04020 [Sulfurimonas lithotrophica]
MGRKVLTESCVIKCAHGGVVDHPSSDSIRTIGGLKPNFCTDILGAPISGCPVPYTPCTSVASTSDAMTESNVVGASGTYALDVSGCMTDMGASLVIDSRANSNSATSTQASANNSVEGIEATEQEEQEAKEKEEKEEYKLYLLRESKNSYLKKVYKPLRPSRSFIDSKTFYGSMDTNPIIRDKTVPFTLAFVYIVLADSSIDEYRVISRGSLYAETFKDINYKDKSNIQRPYIPLYDGESIKVYYSNIQLSKDKTKRENALSKLEALEYDPTDTNKKENSFFLKDSSSIDTNEISEDIFKLQKKYEPKDKPYPLDVVLTMKDSVGEAEDLLNIYEWHYKTAFSINDTKLKELKQKNSYIYAVSQQVDYFYVDKDEQKTYNDTIKKLKKLYRKLADEVCNGVFSKKIIKAQNDVTPLNEIIDPAFDTAENYINQVKYINKSFFKNILDGVANNRGHREKHLYDEGEFIVTNNGMSSKYVGLVSFESVKKQNEYVYRRYAQGIKKVRDVNYGYLVLDKHDEDKYKNYQKNAPDMLALLVFSLFFSKEYKEEAKTSGLYETAKEFYVTLKNAKPLPSIGDDNIKDIQNLIHDQKHSYAKICSKENKLLDQFESIDTINKESSFDFGAIKAPKSLFSNLYIQKEFSEFYKDKTNPKDILTKAVKSVEDEAFAKVFKMYSEFKEFDSQKHKVESLNTMMGLFYTFSSTRSLLDAEANINSPFNDKTKHLVELLENFVELKNTFTDEEIESKIFSLPIYTHFLKTLNSHITHSMVKADKNSQGFSQREANVKALLEKYKPDQSEIKEFDLSNLLSDDFDTSEEAKKTIADFYGALTKIESYASKAMKVTDEYGKIDDTEISDSRESKTNQYEQSSFTTTKEYKTIASSIQSLSVFVAGVNVAIGVINYKELKYKDIIPLMSDTFTTIETFSNMMPKKKEDVVKSLQQLLSKNELERIGSWKLMSKLGVLAVAISAVYDLTQLEDDDLDGAVAIVAKNVTVIALLVAPVYLAFVPGIGWIAALGILAVEVAWEMYFKDLFTDTPVESYIMKSILFHKNDDDNMLAPFISPLGYAIYRYINDTPYQAQLFTEAVNIKEKDLVKGFSSLDELQTFMGDNYDKYEDLFNNALQYELTTLKSVVLSYKVDTVNSKEEKTYNGREQVLQTKVKIPKEMLQNNIQVMLKIDSDYTTIYESELTTLGEVPSMPNDFTYDTIARKKLVDGKVVLSNDFTLDEAKMLSKKDIYLFVVNRDIALKYKITYDLSSFTQDEYDPESYAFKNNMNFSIDRLKLVPLETKERNMLDNIVYARREKERSLSKQNNREAS